MLTHVTANSPFPTESKLYFPVVERDITFIEKSGNAHPFFRAPKHKALLRSDESGDPLLLSIVGNNYKVVPNKELFPYIEDHMTRVIDDRYLGDITVNEHMSYGGRDCYREYIFNDMKCDVKQGDVAYRAIVGNSYGSKAVTLISGAIDFWCSNGMISGQSEKQARKHTSGITMNGISEWINKSLDQFASNAKRMVEFEKMEITPLDELKMFEHLTEKKYLSKHHAKLMNENMHKEHVSRGRVTMNPSMWHFYSALTGWATHEPVRKTENDHEANSRIQRSQRVEQIMQAALRHAYVEDRKLLEANTQ